MATKPKAANKKKAVVTKKAAPARSSAAKRTSKPTKSQVFVKSKVSTPSDSTPPLRIRKLYVVLAIIVIALIALAFKYRGVFVAASVNGRPISRMSVVKEAEKQSGKQALENIIRNNLIEQEAKKKNVTVSDQEVSDEIKKVESNLSKQGQKLDQVLTVQGINREDLKKLIKLDKMVGKIVGKDVKVSDKEVSDYIEKNRDSLPAEQTEEQLKATVAAQLKQQALSAKVQAWLSEIRSKAKVQYFVQY